MNGKAPFHTSNWSEWNTLPQHRLLINWLENQVLPAYVPTCRWFAGKARQAEQFRLQHLYTVPSGDRPAYMALLTVRYAEGEPEMYLLPLALLPEKAAAEQRIPAKAALARLLVEGDVAVLLDAIYDESFRQALYRGLAEQQALPQPAGHLLFQRGRGLAEADAAQDLPGRVLPVDSSNSALVYGDTYFLKLYRKLFAETNPEVETVSFITENSDFANIPAYAGSLVLRRDGEADVTLLMMQRMVENQKDSWALTGDYLNDFLYAVPNRLFAIREEVFEMVEQLGRRTGEMHSALYNPRAGADFAPEGFTPDYRAFLIGRIGYLLENRYNLLIEHYQRLDPLSQRLAWVFMEAKELIDDFVSDFRTRPIDSLRIRIHGDYHLGQVLATDTDDFVIIDFEGEPESSITERKIKHSPLKDVAGMIRSFHYAVCAKLFNSRETETIDPDHLQRVSDRWFKLIRDTYVDTYLDTFGSPHPLFKDNTEINFLLLFYLLEKAVYELGYEISYRPSWVRIPLKGIVDVIRGIEKIRMADTNRHADIQPLQTGLLQTKKV